MGLQINTYLGKDLATIFDRIATRLGMSRYEAAHLAIEKFVEEEHPKENACKVNPVAPDSVSPGSHERSENTAEQETRSGPPETSAHSVITPKPTIQFTRNPSETCTS